MTIEQKRRELFEAWADNIGLPHSMLTCGEWAAFNAALDAVVIQMPADFDCYDGGQTMEDCIAAIESTGLGLKVKP